MTITRFRSPLRWGLLLLIGLTASVGLALAGAYLYLAPEIPEVEALRDVRLQVPLRIYSRDGKLLAQIGEQRRIPVAYADYPQSLIQAFLAAEDDQFFQHSGVDYPGLVRALAVNLASGARREGGGTITMQLARNMFLSPERSYRRKALEIISAWRIEHAFAKEEILALYLNKIFLGQRAYGVGAAAEVYFGKTVSQLDLAEVALLAGLPRAPSRENPVSNPDLAKQRRAYVLRRMRELGYIIDTQRIEAENQPVQSQLHGFEIDLNAPYIAEMARLELESRYGQRIYTDNFSVYTTVDSRLQSAAERSLRLGLLEYDSRHGFRGKVGSLPLSDATEPAELVSKLGKYPELGGLKPAVVLRSGPTDASLMTVTAGRVSLNLEGVQWARPVVGDTVGPRPTKVSDVLNKGDVVYIAQQSQAAWRLMQVPDAQAALAVLDPTDGAIVALQGGFDFDGSRFNRATQAKRQPGSSFKPFLYSAALDNGFTPASIVNDAPLVVADGSTEEPWRPQNTNREFMGPMRLREALVRSRNLVSIRLISSLGPQAVTEYIKKFGFTDAELPLNLSLALGATQVTPLSMARGYAVFANGGQRVEPYLIERVYGGEGELIFAATPRLACDQCDAAQNFATEETDTGTHRVPVSNNTDADASQNTATAAPDRAPQVISRANAFLMTDMMKDVIRRGTATRALSLNRRDIAGKTGTTNDRRDAWFVGFNSDLVAAAWVGFDQERPLGNGEEGGRTALPIWIHFMRDALQGRPEHTLQQPEGVVNMRISAETGQAEVAAGERAMFEYFMTDHTPEVMDASPEEAQPTPSTGSDGLF